MEKDGTLPALPAVLQSTEVVFNDIVGDQGAGIEKYVDGTAEVLRYLVELDNSGGTTGPSQTNPYSAALSNGAGADRRAAATARENTIASGRFSRYSEPLN